MAAALSIRGYDDEVVAAGLLHDAIEDTEADVADVRQRFGDRVAPEMAIVHHLAFELWALRVLPPVHVVDASRMT